MELSNLSVIENLIFDVRGKQVMLDFHLAEVYQVETKRLNEQVKRNSKRFPEAFMFQLTEEEWEYLQSQIATSSNLQSQNATAKRRTNPYAFTEQGVAMLSAVLKSETAITASIQIMDAFVKMRHIIHSNGLLHQRMTLLESKQKEADKNFEKIFSALEKATPQPEKGVFFDGEIFDAYVLVSKLIKSAKKSILLIDNYVDESVLTLLSKRETGVSATIYTQKITPTLQLDINKHNQQYPPVEIKKLNTSHDRFLIIDEQQLFHIGASLKDLGKKWFAFSQMDSLVSEVLNKLNSNS